MRGRKGRNKHVTSSSSMGTLHRQLDESCLTTVIWERSVKEYGPATGVKWALLRFIDNAIETLWSGESESE